MWVSRAIALTEAQTLFLQHVTNCMEGYEAFDFMQVEPHMPPVEQCIPQHGIRSPQHETLYAAPPMYVVYVTTSVYDSGIDVHSFGQYLVLQRCYEVARELRSAKQAYGDAFVALLRFGFGDSF